MIRNVATTGLGKHDHAIDLDPDGPNEITGPSGAGKSTGIIAGICRVLWGCGPDGRPFPPGLVRGPVLDVAITTKKGAILRRTQPRGGTIDRTITRPATAEERQLGVTVIDEPYTNEEAWRKKLGPFAHDAARLVLVPMAWRELAEGEGGGRPLRDVLAKILPGGDLRAEVAAMMTAAGHSSRPADPITERGAGEARTAANRRRDEAAGRLAEAKRRTVPDPLPRPAPVTVAEARKMLAAAEAGKAAELRRDWTRRRDALGPAPEAMPSADAENARANVKRQERTVDACKRAVLLAEQDVAVLGASTRTGDPDLEAAIRKRDELAARVDALAKAGAAHPLCTRPCCKDAEREAEMARTSLASATMYRDELARGAAVRLAKEEERQRSRLQDATEKHTAAVAASTAAVMELERLRAIVSADDAVLAARKGWAQSIAALGTEPPQVDATGPAASAERVDAARAAIEADTRAQGAATLAEAAEKAYRDGLAEAEAAATATATEAVRADALLVAVRAAPGTLAARGVAALGDLGPVQVRFEGDGVSVTYQERPWWCASTGERIVGDVWFRLALRRAMGPAYAALPLIVDDIGSVGGLVLPTITGQSIMLRTTADERLTVRR